MLSNTTIWEQEVYGKQLLSNLSNYFLIWYIPLVVFIGTLGAAFCMMFIFLSKMFPRMIQIWLVSICFGDFMTLIWDALRMFLKLAFRYDFRDDGIVICKMQAYLSNFFFYWSAYNQAAMSIQRLYFIASPLRARTLLNTKRVFIIWALMTSLLLLPNLTYLLYWHIGPSGDCEPENKWFYYVTTVLDMVIWGIVPLASMCVSTSWISYRLIRYKQENFVAKFGSKQSNNGATNTKPMISSGAGRKHGGNDQSSHVTRLLVGMNLFYLLSTFPLLIYMMHLNFNLQNKVGKTIAKSMHKFYYYLFRSICYLNASLNWVFYCAAGRIFRQKARHMLRTLFSCGSRRAADFSLTSNSLADKRSVVTAHSHMTNAQNRPIAQNSDDSDLHPALRQLQNEVNC